MIDWFDVELRHDGALDEEPPSPEEQARIDADATEDSRACPRCHGSGEVGAPGYSVNPSSGMLGRDPQNDESGPCPGCGGTGAAG